MSIKGAFDQTTESLGNLRHACAEVMAGRVYWSRSLRQTLTGSGRAEKPILRQLSFTERLVLSVISDGCDDAEAARQLDISETTVMTVRRNLHRKLGVRQKGELVRCAAVYGFVLFTAQGVVKPGLAEMISTRNNRRQRDPQKDCGTEATGSQEPELAA
jgi:DNA-binding CsgD family transcriptional regulator